MKLYKFVKYWLLPLCVLFFTIGCERACDYLPLFCKKNNVETDTIDFTKVDRFPVFENCNVLDDQVGFQTCFEETLHQSISEKLELLQLVSEHPIDEVINIKFSIKRDGTFQYKKIECSDSLCKLLPDLTSNIQTIFKDLKVKNAATKHGIPVVTNHILPMDIYVE